MKKLILSVFPGVDLLGRAFEQEGFCVVRGPDLLWAGDIRVFHPPAGVFEGVIGGPPCPEWSPLRSLIKAHGYKTKHGNMIPEFERVVSEAKPNWFLMEEGSLAPIPTVTGYSVHSFYLSPIWLGEEQMRKRRIAFGIQGTMKIDLRKFIDYAVFEPLKRESAVIGEPVNNDPERKAKVRQTVVTHDPNPYPVALNPGGKPKIRLPAVTTRTELYDRPQDHERKAFARVPPVLTSGQPTVYEAGKVRKLTRRTWEESCRLQGLPGDFLKESPFTLEGKRQVLANGVPMCMGLQIAKAIKKALESASI